MNITKKTFVLDSSTREELMVEGMTAIRNIANDGDDRSAKSSEERLEAIGAISQALHNMNEGTSENVILTNYLEQYRKVGYGVFTRYTPKLASVMHALVLQGSKFLELNVARPGPGKNIFMARD